MNILTIPFRSARQKPLRFMLLLTVFTLGVSSIVGLQTVSKEVGHSMEQKLTSYGANILITPTTETLTVSYGGFDMGNMLYEMRYLPEAETVQSIRSIGHKDRLAAVAPKLVSMAQVNGKAVGVVGVRWDQELNLKSFWTVDGRYPENADDLIAGAEAARALHLAPGVTLRLLGGDFVVAGVLAPTGGEDDKVLFTELGTLQSLTSRPNQVNYVEAAALCSGCPIDDITSQMASVLQGVDIKALQSVIKQRMFSINFVQQLAMAVGLVILVTACAMVGLSMLSAVNERKREIGLLRCLGYGKGRVFLVFCVEALALGCLSGALGYSAGLGLSEQVLVSLDVAESTSVAFDPLMLILCAGAMAALSALSAAIPSWKASRVDPAQAVISV